MRSYLSLVKFSHTIFAMPFAMIGFFLALKMNEIPFDYQKIILVIGCMITARNAAMAFNRWLDRDIDGANPRTTIREIPKGIIKANQALVFVILNAILFVVLAYFINELCFFLSPIALVVILGYSYTKRFTILCHLILGVGLALAPIGAYLAVYPQFDWIPVCYGLAVLFWVAGFDIIYALQDTEFDAEHKLFSIPSYFGRTKALKISMALHIVAAALIILAGYLSYQSDLTLGLIHLLAIALFIGLLIYQHLLVRPDDLTQVNLAFFTTNGVGSLLFGILVILDLYL